MADLRTAQGQLDPATVGAKAGSDARSVSDMARAKRLAPVGFISGTVVVNHKLGRKPVGYLVVWAEFGVPSFYVLSSNDKQITFASATSGIFTLAVW